MPDMKTTVTLTFKEVPSTALAMAGVQSWMATLGGYHWLIFKDPVTDTFSAGYRSIKQFQSGISSNPILILAAGLETFEEAAELCYEEYSRMSMAN